jgi:YD repeat-containing protein
MTILALHNCYSQELDIFQNDSIYYKNKISARTMYSINGSTLQKELVTYYSSAGRKIKQFWYWNGEKDFHNVETFYYSPNGQLSTLIDSSGDGSAEITAFYYDDNGNLQKRISIEENDTTDVRTYPKTNTTTKCWYTSGKPYRFDTTIFEKENVKLEYWGTEKSRNSDKDFKWHYTFENEFDKQGNLIKVSAKVENPYKSFTRYIYDKRGLLIKKQEVIYNKKNETIQTQSYFTYE